LVNDKYNPIRYSEVRIKSKLKQTDKYNPPSKEVLAKNVITGFCGTDIKLMEMGEKRILTSNFPKGENRLINGHEVIAYNPKTKNYGVLLARGGNSDEPTRFKDDETIFEYGCSEDGGMCYESFYHPDMLLDIPKKALNKNGKLKEDIAKRLIFSDAYACAMFQRERIEEIAFGHNYRLFLKEEGNEKKAKEKAIKEIYKRVVVFGPGTTGFFTAIEIDRACKEHNIKSNIIAIGRRSDMPQVNYLKKNTDVRYMQNKYKDIKELAGIVEAGLGGKATLFIAASGDSIEGKLAFKYGLLGNNSIYDNISLGTKIKLNSFQLSFSNQIVFGSVNYRREHMEKAIEKLVEMPVENLVNTFLPEEVKKDPVLFFKTRAHPLDGKSIKSAVVWNKELLGK